MYPAMERAVRIRIAVAMELRSMVNVIVIHRGRALTAENSFVMDLGRGMGNHVTATIITLEHIVSFSVKMGLSMERPVFVTTIEMVERTVCSYAAGMAKSTNQRKSVDVTVVTLVKTVVISPLRENVQ